MVSSSSNSYGVERNTSAKFTEKYSTYEQLINHKSIQYPYLIEFSHSELFDTMFCLGHLTFFGRINSSTELLIVL